MRTPAMRGTDAVRTRVVMLAAPLALTLAVASACTDGPAQGSTTSRPSHQMPSHLELPARPASSRQLALAGSATNWTTYHADAARSGFVAGLPAAGPLAIDWSRKLDGVVYGQPLVIGSMVIAATENDTVYGLDRAMGNIRWMTHLGTPLPLAQQPCGDIDPLGITGTPVFYRGLVYVVAQIGRTEHLLAGLAPTTGRVMVHANVPSPDHEPFYDQQRGALAAANGRIYVPFGGHFGDCGPYHGSVVGMPASGTGPIVSFVVPSRMRAGIWAPGGAAINANGTLFVGVGNGTNSPPFDGSDSVNSLTPNLSRIDIFAPATWLSDNQNDLDLGSMTPALSGPWVLTVGKRGTGYLLRADRLGGIGGQVAKHPVCGAAFGGAAVNGSSVYVPCPGGMAAVAISNGGFNVLWHGPAAGDGSPVGGGGAIWVLGVFSGILYEVNPQTGHVMNKISLGTQLPHFASPSLSGRLVLVGTTQGVIAVSGA